MQNSSQIGFGDNVRVLSTPETKALDLAGQVGQVYGETTPSVTGVVVVGQLVRDYAVNVHFDGRTDTLWFAPELLEFVDHAAGTEIRLDKVPKNCFPKSLAMIAWRILSSVNGR